MLATNPCMTHHTAPVHLVCMPEKTPERIRRYREERRLALEDVAAKINMSWQAVQKVETGQTRLSWDWARRLARAYDMDPTEVLFGEPAPTVPVVGYVGAGAQVFPVNDHPVGQGIERVACPRGLNPETTEAVRVRGDSMYPISDGWVLFYSRASEPADVVVGQLCIVRLAGDGPTLVKQVRPGYSPGRFNLVSTNAAPIDDAALEWASRVRQIVPPDLADVGPDSRAA